MARIRVVHFLNQYFAGLGGEEQADLAPRLLPGPVGCGAALARRLGPGYEIVATLVAGDNYQTTRPDERAATFIPLLRPLSADLLVAGPAFGSGRYSLACASLCMAISRTLGIRALAAMAPSAPGAELYGGFSGIVPTDGDVRCMDHALDDLTAAVAGRSLPAAPGPEPPALPVAWAAPPLLALSRSRIALLTTCGLALRQQRRPAGRPSLSGSGEIRRIPTGPAARLEPERYEVVHPGYWNQAANADPERVAPLSALRALVAAGQVGGCVPAIYSVSGFGRSRRDGWALGVNLARRLRQAGADGALLISS